MTSSTRRPDAPAVRDAGKPPDLRPDDPTMGHDGPSAHAAAQLHNLPAFQYNTSFHSRDDTATEPSHRHHAHFMDLHIRTDVPDADRPRSSSQRASWGSAERSRRMSPEYKAWRNGGGPPGRSSSVKSLSAGQHHTGGSLSPASIASSPNIGPLADLTPLPSPLGSKSASWAVLPPLPSSALSVGSDADRTSPTQAQFPRSASLKRRAVHPPLSPTAEEQNGAPAAPSSEARPPSPTPLRRIVIQPATVVDDEAADPPPQGRNRSLSEYVPPGGPQRPPRPIAVSGSKTPSTAAPPPKPMHREEHLAVQRGLSALPTPRPPTPPRSTKAGSTGGSSTGSVSGSAPGGPTDSAAGSLPPSPDLDEGRGLPMRYEATVLATGRTKRWFAVRQLGTGTFSTVMLATSDPAAAAALAHRGDDGTPNEDGVDPRSLAAVKVCALGPAGGADASKVRSSLQRELDILKAVRHPSLIRLRAVSVLAQRAFLVLPYCPGGDLFELASLRLDALGPGLVRRMFAELVDAVRALHAAGIVHRDIKLENVLVNLPTPRLADVADWPAYPRPVVTLTDLGLGRRLPAPPASPLLHTRCGSEDYAAPELLMGQAYDGRATDAWALGVLLYALLEGRLPFDPLPGARRQSPTSHRIARCEWGWARRADAEGEWDEARGVREGLEGARECVEGLLRRVSRRWGLERVAQVPWVKGGVQVPGGLQIEAEDD